MEPSSLEQFGRTERRMIIAKVVGSAVATLKHETLRTNKLLLVRPADAQGKVLGEPFLAVDLVGAGEGELVIVSQGSSARMATGQTSSPVDAAIVGILDSLRMEESTTFRKE
jgi:microcompartment protein CcmK/EutM